ncbi:hypothetical protein DT076_07010 [Desertihabitans brevis]|uniref:Regulator of SigK n=1 Tax=Desertihabitans brevis TaxID=2268447 RepID=A0A367YZL6_9ACTN|nr:anti-sigma factor [Desertihabitans brevis]RCK70391.1 hypothetical protein DT076_07010 [Desertihabitans brevis]
MSHDVHADVGAYAVGALNASAREVFEAHLPHCPQCTREVTEFAETTAELARLTETPPPPELRAAVLGAVRSVRPLPPETEPAPATPGEVTAPRWTAGPVDEPSEAEAPEDELAARRPRRRGRLLPALVAAAVVVALTLGGWAAVLRQQLDEAAVVAAEESELLAAPDLRVVTIELPDGGRASYALSREQDRVMLAAPTLPDPPEGRAYQLWTMQLDEAGEPVAGTVEPHDVFAGGRDIRVFFDGLRGTDAFAITVEDETGATTPTMSTIFGIAPV